MGHTKAVPEHQRPTLEELEIQDVFVRHNRFMVVEVRGLWEDSEAEFRVILKGNAADVMETIECLKENGNLMGIDPIDITG